MIKVILGDLQHIFNEILFPIAVFLAGFVFMVASWVALVTYTCALPVRWFKAFHKIRKENKAIPRCIWRRRPLVDKALEAYNLGCCPDGWMRAPIIRFSKPVDGLCPECHRLIELQGPKNA